MGMTKAEAIIPFSKSKTIAFRYQTRGLLDIKHTQKSFCYASSITSIAPLSSFVPDTFSIMLNSTNLDTKGIKFMKLAQSSM